MKISKIRTAWIISISAFNTALTLLRAIAKQMTGRLNRVWVDKTLQDWSNRLLSHVQVDCKVFNHHNVQPVPGRANIIMCNHSSLYDIPISFKAFPNHSIRMLAKKELSNIPLMGKGMTATEFPFIDRKNRVQAIKDLESMRQLMQSGIVMWIFPEGTRSRDGKLKAFKKGAFISAIQSKALIIPIGIKNAYKILPARTTEFDLKQTAEIHIGLPIDAADYSFETKEQLVERVHHAIEMLMESTD